MLFLAVEVFGFHHLIMIVVIIPMAILPRETLAAQHSRQMVQRNSIPTNVRQLIIPLGVQGSVDLIVLEVTRLLQSLETNCGLFVIQQLVNEVLRKNAIPKHSNSRLPVCREEGLRYKSLVDGSVVILSIGIGFQIADSLTKVRIINSYQKAGLVVREVSCERTITTGLHRHRLQNTIGIVGKQEHGMLLSGMAYCRYFSMATIFVQYL
uniref:Putative secreted protein n=1 Tax=Anopheles darlingi TaxID=43151 RepID=A0A2M4D605_ANODA